MPNPPDDWLIDAVPDAPVLAAALDTHLDEYPLAVDADEVDAVLARLEARLEPSTAPAKPARPHRHVRGWVGPALAVAALALLALGGALQQWRSTPSTIEGDQPAVVTLRASASGAEDVQRVSWPSTRREADITGGATVDSLTAPRTVVLVVRDGELRLDDGSTVPRDHWALVTRVEDGTPGTVVFPDGRPPPTLDADTWDVPEVHRTLQTLRWETLPDPTRSRLDSLLTEPRP